MTGRYSVHVHPRRQRSGYTCGPASIRIALTYFHLHVPEDELAILCRTTRRDGTTAVSMKRALRVLGFRPAVRWHSDLGTFPRACRSIGRYLRHGAPVILCFRYPTWSESHYAVVREIDFNHRRVRIQDPKRSGRHTRTVDFGELRRIWWLYHATGAPWFVAVRPPKSSER
jgi:ABC-type bacteriocin/lantibiotic exporter with double-glycine peptidase domain